MPFTENPGSSSPLASFGRSIWSFRREQVHSMEGNQDPSVLELDLESFQHKLAEQFQDLSSVTNDELLSIPWIGKLLDAFLVSLEDFRLILYRNRVEISKPPLDRLVDDFFERSVKALDICNAARDGVDKIRQWHRHLDIVLSALDSHRRALSEGQFRRARKALVDLLFSMLDEKDSSVFSQRNRSFGRQQIKKSLNHLNHNQQQQQPGSASGSGSGSGSGHTRSLSWSVAHSWSATKQLQSIANGLSAPRANEVAATNGLAVPIFSMSFVLTFVLWVLVAAIPCQDRGLNVHFTPPKNSTSPWGPALASLQGRILEESKKRENKNSNGLLREIGQVERLARSTSDLVDSVHFPLTDDQRAEVELRVEEIGVVSGAFRGGLDPLERQIREVFRKIMACRTDGLDILNKGNVLE